jgi:hypothetical protein
MDALSVESPLEFPGAVNAFAWDEADAATWEDAIRRALLLGYDGIARWLSAQAVQHHPDNAALTRLAALVAPPRLLGRRSSPNAGVSTSMRWFDQHRGEYQGQWVAIHHGEIVGHAASREMLEVELPPNLEDVLIDRMP